MNSDLKFMELISDQISIDMVSNLNIQGIGPRPELSMLRSLAWFTYDIFLDSNLKPKAKSKLDTKLSGDARPAATRRFTDRNMCCLKELIRMHSLYCLFCLHDDLHEKNTWPSSPLKSPRLFKSSALRQSPHHLLPPPIWPLSILQVP